MYRPGAHLWIGLTVERESPYLRRACAQRSHRLARALTRRLIGRREREVALRPVRTFAARQVVLLCEHSLRGRDIDLPADEFLAPAAQRMTKDRREPGGGERIELRRQL